MFNSSEQKMNKRKVGLMNFNFKQLISGHSRLVIKLPLPPPTMPQTGLRLAELRQAKTSHYLSKLF